MTCACDDVKWRHEPFRYCSVAVADDYDDDDYIHVIMMTMN